MAYDEAVLRRSARERLASWRQGDPRGILADTPIHFNAESITRDLSKGVGKAAEAFAKKRQQLLDAQAAAAAALQKHQDRMAEKAVGPKTKGEQDRATWLATADEKIVGGRRLRKLANQDFYTDIGPELFAPKSQSFYDFSAHNPYGKEEARIKAIDSITANAGKYMGRKTILRGEPMLDSNNQPMFTTDMAGNKISVLAGRNTDVYVGMSGASKAAQDYFKEGVRIVAAKLVGDINADQAVAALQTALPAPSDVGGQIPADVHDVYHSLSQYVFSRPGAIPVAPQTTTPLTGVTAEQAAEIKALMDSDPKIDYEIARIAVTGK